MGFKKIILSLMVLFTVLLSHAQYMSKSALQKMYAETKQVSQFFRRFNGEEDRKGKIIYENSKDYRSEKMRHIYFPYLFDQAKFNSGSIEQEFESEVIKKHEFLNFRSQNWMAQVECEFLYNNVPTKVQLFFKVEEENGGTKWVLSDIWFDKYQQQTEIKEVPEVKFIHPKSHELDFMNLNKIFEPENNPLQYTQKGYKPDFLSIFIYEYNQGLWKFQQVNRTWFHVWQIPAWYFTIEYKNRSDLNSGWLLTNLLDVSKINKNELEKYIVTSLH